MQVTQANSEIETQTEGTQTKEIVTQTDFSNNLNSVDCQTDEIVIKEQKELDTTYISAYVQTVRSKPQQRTVGFQIDAQKENAKVMKQMVTQTNINEVRDFT